MLVERMKRAALTGGIIIVVSLFVTSCSAANQTTDKGSESPIVTSTIPSNIDTVNDVVALDDNEASKLPLITSIPDRNIKLYAQESDGVVLKVGDSERKFDWIYATPQDNKPVMEVNDYDADGQDELAVILHIGSGTGVAVYELHVLEINTGTPASEFLQDQSFKQEDYLKQISNGVKFKIVTKAGERQGELVVGNKRHTISLKDYPTKDFGKISDDLVFGSIVNFSVEDHKLKARFGVGLQIEASPVPEYIGYIHANVNYKAGKFKLSDLRFEKNPE